MTTTTHVQCSVEGCTYPYPEYVPHFNCLYNGNAIGHSKCHCTADACY